MAPTRTLFQRRITLQFLALFCRSATTIKALVHATVLTHANTKKVLHRKTSFVDFVKTVSLQLLNLFYEINE